MRTALPARPSIYAQGASYCEGWLAAPQVWGAEEAIGELVKVEGAYSKPEAVRTDQRTPYLITRLTSPV